MAKRRPARKSAREAPRSAQRRASWNPLQGRRWVVLLAVVVMVFYWTPLIAALGGLAGGMMVLAGHFQTTLYAFGGLGLFAAGELIVRRKDWARIAGFVAITVALAFLVSAVQTLPGLELTGESIRAGSDLRVQPAEAGSL